MCGRFTSLLSPELLQVIFGVQAPPNSLPRYNIAPTQQAMVVRGDASNSRYLSTLQWGLVPHWAKDTSIGSKMISARSETVHEKPAFRQAIRSRRCIVPASGFYEWKALLDGKQPYYVTMMDGSPLAFAGIWESWKDGDGQALETFSILTTGANSLMGPIHERMPVILHWDDFDTWLDRTINDPQKLQRLYQPYPSEMMQAWPVSIFVNSPAHFGEECIHRVTL